MSGVISSRRLHRQTAKCPKTWKDRLADWKWESGKCLLTHCCWAKWYSLPRPGSTEPGTKPEQKRPRQPLPLKEETLLSPGVLESRSDPIQRLGCHIHMQQELPSRKSCQTNVLWLKKKITFPLYRRYLEKGNAVKRKIQYSHHSVKTRVNSLLYLLPAFFPIHLNVCVHVYTHAWSICYHSSLKVRIIFELFNLNFLFF